MPPKRNNKHYEDILEQGKDLIKFYLENPTVAAYDLLGVDFAAIQRLVFNDMWFKDYVITIAGRGFGKSNDINNLSYFNNKGLVYLREELPPIPSYLRDGEDEVIDWDTEVYTSEGYRPTKKLCLEKGIEGKSIKTQNGFENRGSNHHPLLTINPDCEFVYKNLEDLVPGDRLCIQRNQSTFGNNNVSIDDSYLIGLLIGDGHIRTQIGITSADDYILDYCEVYCKSCNIRYKKSYKSGKNTHSFVFWKEFEYFFEKYGIDRVLSYGKSVPYSIRTSTRESQIAFLQGYFDTDGTVNSTNGGVSCCSVSKKLLQEIQLMLLNFGIVSRLREKRTNSKFGIAYLLDIFSEDAYKFKTIIGFRLKRKQAILDEYFKDKVLNINKDTIPYALQLCHSITKYYHNTYTTSKKPSFRIRTRNKKELSYKRLDKFIEQCREIELSGFSLSEVKDRIDKLNIIIKYNYYFDTVESTCDWKGDCYDFEMNMESNVEPNYFSNGFINHNTFTIGTLAVLSAMLKPGYRVGLISPSFRQCLFSDIENLPIFTNKGMYNKPLDFYNSIDSDTIVQSLDSSNMINNKWSNPKAEGLIISTNRGLEIGGLNNHRVLTINSDLDLVYKELKDITVEDNLVIKKGFNLFGNDNSLPTPEFTSKKAHYDCKYPKELSKDLSYWIGMLVGDGCVMIGKDNKSYRINFTNQDDDLLCSFNDYLSHYFIDENKVSDTIKNNNTHMLNYSSKKLVNLLLSYGLTRTTAIDKEIPWVVNKASMENVSAFISGLMDTDGCVYVQENKGCTVHLSTSSIRLAKQVQAWWLNFGILSTLTVDKVACNRKLNGRDKESICATSYKVRITSIPDLIKFRDVIGFRCSYKKNKLNDYLSSVNHVSYRASNLIPGSSKVVLSLVEDCKLLFGYGDIEQNKLLGKIKNNCSNYSDVSSNRIKQLIEFAEKYNVLSDSYYKLKGIIDKDISFVKPISIKKHIAETIDIEVENENCYWAGGFVNHNSKMIFAECEKLYAQSSIFREACEKPPVRGTDSCYIRFKSVGGMAPSYIEAVPLGNDGAKIRGSRFYLVVVDELAQVPNQILDLVIKPMSATSLAPMERVHRIEQQKQLIKLGLASQDDFEKETVNKMIMTSSGFYKFNHMWRRMRDYWQQMDTAEKSGTISQYSVWQVPYWDLPEGFLDMDNIESAKRTMSSHEFSMEYEAAMVSDSEGFFKASALDDCTLGSGFNVEAYGDKNASYIMGVDPNQGGKASTGIVLLRLGDSNKVVNVMELKNFTTPEITKTIQGICDNFNIVRILMDRGGGGKPICDFLEEGYDGAEPIIDRNNLDHINRQGRHILEMIAFSPSWISDANFTTKSMIENKKLLFPEVDTGELSDSNTMIHDNVNMLKSQMLNIVVTQTATGVLHFDTPSKNQNKDLYSALILAAYGANELSKPSDEEESIILHNTSGMIRLHDASDFYSIGGGLSVLGASSSGALLKKKKK